MLNLSLGDVMFVSIKNYICKNFVCRMCVRWWVYVSETRFCFSCEVLMFISIIIIIIVVYHLYFSFCISVVNFSVLSCFVISMNIGRHVPGICSSVCVDG